MLLSCETQPEIVAEGTETLMTEQSNDLTMLMSQNGMRSYRFHTPLMEGYKLAKDPYMEFPQGVYIETYENDSTETIESTLTADYAIFFTDRQLWQAKGNVVAVLSEGQTLYTQQLFWDQRSRRIYSNVDSKVVKGEDAWLGEGFESPDAPPYLWRFRRFKGKMRVKVEPVQRADSLAGDSSALAESPSRVAEPQPDAGRARPSGAAAPRVRKPAPERRPEEKRTVPSDGKLLLRSADEVREQRSTSM